MISFQKIRNILLWLIIFLLPTQLGIHFWPDFSFVAGFRIDYLSPTIYLTDILIFLYIIFSVSKKGLTLKGLKIRRSDLIVILASVFFIFLNIFFSNSIPLTLISWIKVLFYILFFLSLSQEKNLLKKIQTPLIFSVIFTIGLEISQLIKQESLNGIFYWLGERSFNLSTPNIAKIKINSEFLIINYELLRPYATFSHPNSLAGFLLLSLLLIKKSHLRGVIFLGILLTFSKAAILALLAIVIYQKLKPNLQPIFFKTILFLSLTISLIPLLTNQLPLPFRSFSVGGTILSRLYLGPPTLQVVKENFFFGVGLNNFIPALSKELSANHIFINTLQPIHSVPLLAFSELGLAGLIILISLLIKGLTLTGAKRAFDVSQKRLDLIGTLIILAITGSIDHYWWTLHQNHLILIICFAILLQARIKNKHAAPNTNNKH